MMPCHGDSVALGWGEALGDPQGGLLISLDDGNKNRRSLSLLYHITPHGKEFSPNLGSTVLWISWRIQQAGHRGATQICSDLGQGPQRFNTHTHIISFSRAVVLKLGHKSKSPGDLVTTDGWAPPPEFFISRTRVGAENFHFCQVFRGCWCCQVRYHTLRSNVPEFYF